VRREGAPQGQAVPCAHRAAAKVSPGLGSRGLDPGHVAPTALEAYPVALRLDGVVR
jgi:hypothetical protein